MKRVPAGSEIVNRDVAKICDKLNEILTSHSALEEKLSEPENLTLSPIFLKILSGVIYDRKEALSAGLALELLDIAVLKHYPGVFGRFAEEETIPQNIDIITGDYFYSRALEAVGRLKDPEVIRILARAIADISEGVEDYYYKKNLSGEELVSIVEKLCSLYRAAAEIVVHFCSKKQEFSKEVSQLVERLFTGIGGLKLLQRMVSRKEKTEGEKFAKSYFSKSVSEALELLRKRGLAFNFEDALP